MQSGLEAFGVEVPQKVHDRGRKAHEVPHGPVRHLGLVFSSRPLFSGDIQLPDGRQVSNPCLVFPRAREVRTW